MPELKGQELKGRNGVDPLVETRWKAINW
jgi:hypothetical protein